MARFDYRLVDVFTPVPFQGNPLAVFAEGREIPEALMPRIAAELNLSETTFVLPSSAADCDFRVRIFTPRVELPMAGHPTIGTAWVLDHGDRVTFEEGVGRILVERDVTDRGGTVWTMSQKLPAWGRRADAGEVAAALGLERGDVAGDLPVEVVSCGVPFLIVPLRRLDALARARARVDLWSELAERLEAHGLYCFTLETEEAGAAVRSRMFAPNIGVAEDPATGGASGPLGCYLVRHGALPASSPVRFLNVQGVEMGRRSEIHIEIEGTGEAITAVRVGGECAAVGRGSIEVEV
jgi:trans-2,3-dihydro-3-hydroxyanthranilate isomerase